MNILTMMETFFVVIESGSFTKAALKLNLSKSFVSKQVTLLESHLKTRLLYRTTRTLNLTDEGKQFHKRCKSIVEEAEEAKAEIQESQSNPRGVIRITMPQSILMSGAGSLLLKFQHQYPEIQLEIIVSGQVENLTEKSIDVALRIGQLEDSTLKSRKLATCTFHVVASKKYMDINGIPEHPSQLVNHNCIVYGDSRLARSWPFQLTNDESMTVKVKGNCVCNDGNLVIEAALRDQGVCFGPDFLFRKYVAQGELELILENYYHTSTAISALYPFSKTPPRRVILLLDYLGKHLPQHIGT